MIRTFTLSLQNIDTSQTSLRHLAVKIYVSVDNLKWLKTLNSINDMVNIMELTYAEKQKNIVGIIFTV